MKCEEAIAWDGWAKKNQDTLDVTTLKAPADQQQHFENRMNRCFQDALRIGKEMAVKRLAQKMEQVALTCL